MPCKRIHAVVHGKVQGVWFRESSRQEAVKLGLLGWVRNLPDGSVETVFQGEGPAVIAFLGWLNIGSSHALVTRVDYDEEPVSEELQDYYVRF